MRKVDPVKHEEKRHEILAAAERCFIRDGFHGASTSQICAEANISPGHLYHYFDSKEAIVAEMAATRLKGATIRFEGLIKAPDPIRALIEEIKTVTAPKNASGQALHLDILAEGRRNPAIAKILRESYTKGRTLMAAVLLQGQKRGTVDSWLDAELTASVLIGVVESCRATAIRNPEIDAASYCELLETMLLRFLAPPTVPILKKSG